jgi:hypothetical protein
MDKVTNSGVDKEEVQVQVLVLEVALVALDWELEVVVHNRQRSLLRWESSSSLRLLRLREQMMRIHQ